MHGGKLPADHWAECGLVVVPGAVGLLQQKFPRCRLGPKARRLTLTVGYPIFTHTTYIRAVGAEQTERRVSGKLPKSQSLLARPDSLVMVAWIFMQSYY